MATGLPDYHKGVDIALQSLEAISADIVAQSLENLNVDVVAQSIEKLSVDLAAQTLSELNIDVVAQTLANLNIDVNAQSLGQITNRPKYGAAQVAESNITADPMELEDLVSVDGKGIIYGGFLSLYDDETAQISAIHMTIDGNLIADLSLQTFNRYSISKDGMYPFYVTQYDNEKFLYAFGISSMMTFETSVVIEFEENDNGTPTIMCRLIYALI